MSRNTPNPVALTAAMLATKCANAENTANHREEHSPSTIANLASQIHLLAPACKRLAEAECNGEWRDGQRAGIERQRHSGRQQLLDHLDKSITDYATRLDKRIAKLDAELAPFGYQLIRQGDPRGATLVMAEMPVNDSATHFAIG